jgi:site-specific recombinase XerD
VATATSNTPASSQKRPMVRSLPFDLWPPADCEAWTAACRPSQRLLRGGAGAHMKPITLLDLKRRYGYFLDFLDRSGLLDRSAAAAGEVTPAKVDRYIEELKARVGSVTTYGSIYKLRRASQALDPCRDFGWLIEIEKDLALDMRPRSKADRLVLTEVLVEAGLTLMAEAENSATLSPLAKARQFRNGLMVAMLAMHPIRLKNFVSLEIGRNVANTDGSWWIALLAAETKEKRPDERRIDETIAPALSKYLNKYRPALTRKDGQSGALWLSSNTGQAMTYHAVAAAIETTTRMAIGVGISPHMFRTAAASSAAVYAEHNPHLGSALLHHRDRRVTEEHYNRASSLSAATAFRRLIKEL